MGNNILTKSGIMLGLGEKEDEVVKLMKEIGMDLGFKFVASLLLVRSSYNTGEVTRAILK